MQGEVILQADGGQTPNRSMSSLQTDIKASQETLPTAAGRAESRNDPSKEGKAGTALKGFPENKLKAIHMKAQALRDSIASGKEIMEKAQAREKDLLPGNTQTLPVQDYTVSISKLIDNSINFGYVSQP